MLDAIEARRDVATQERESSNIDHIAGGRDDVLGHMLSPLPLSGEGQANTPMCFVHRLDPVAQKRRHGPGEPEFHGKACRRAQVRLGDPPSRALGEAVKKWRRVTQRPAFPPPTPWRPLWPARP